MPPSHPRRAYGQNGDARAVAVGLVAAIEGRVRPMVQRTRTKIQRLRTSPAERAQFAGECSHAVRDFLPWPPFLELLVIILWVRMLNWGERTAFSNAVSKCQWDQWEKWPAEAAPYRIALVADPQLVDPHTYPGRPWPLSTLTIKHTDQYLRRSFESLLGTLHPRSVLFLGDLFDGGREWSTESSHSPERRYRKYGDNFWLKEYTRFGKIFVDPWLRERKLRGDDPEARFEANMPGNHDLGIGGGVQLPVRDRFQSYFGDGNRIQVLGNHTFVTVDSVSLSARMEQDAMSKKKIWEPTDTFLNGAKKKQGEVVRRALRARSHQGEPSLHSHAVIDAARYRHHEPQEAKKKEELSILPTILLTHVPLYRIPGIPCGPLREKYPPTRTKEGMPLVSDDRNSLKIVAGYQYSNVLHMEISNDLLAKIDGVKHVFSGDDHDYCEVLHRGFPAVQGSLREITVKSLSWAMGVRHPGFLQLSLWNPLATNSEGVTFSTGGRIPDGTIKTHLCLMPDQLGIFIQYGQLFLLTLVIILGRATYSAFRHPSVGSKATSYLPVDEQELYTFSQANGSSGPASGHVSTSSSARSSDGATNLRGTNHKASRSGTPLSGYTYQKDDKPDRSIDLPLSLGRSSRIIRQSRRRLFLRNVWVSMRLVAFFALGWYFYLMRTV